MRFFPILVPHSRIVLTGPRSVPWAVVSVFEDRAKLNHGQTLERLAERGGLSPRELACLLTDQSLKERNQWLDEQDALDFIAAILEQH